MSLQVMVSASTGGGVNSGFPLKSTCVTADDGVVAPVCPTGAPRRCRFGLCVDVVARKKRRCSSIGNVLAFCISARFGAPAFVHSAELRRRLHASVVGVVSPIFARFDLRRQIRWVIGKPGERRRAYSANQHGSEEFFHRSVYSRRVNCSGVAAESLGRQLSDGPSRRLLAPARYLSFHAKLSGSTFRSPRTKVGASFGDIASRIVAGRTFREGNGGRNVDWPFPNLGCVAFHARRCCRPSCSPRRLTASRLRTFRDCAVIRGRRRGDRGAHGSR